MRQILEYSRMDFVLVEDEIDTLKNYMEIQKMRFNDAFQYEISIVDKVQSHLIKVPPLLAQPFIENAIEHGFKNIDYQGKINLECNTDGDQLKFSITDNGLVIDHVEQRENHN